MDTRTRKLLEVNYLTFGMVKNTLLIIVTTYIALGVNLFLQTSKHS